MKIIKRGIVPDEREIVTSCHKCKSVLQFKVNEVKIQHDQRDGSCVFFKCPVCGSEVGEDFKYV